MMEDRLTNETRRLGFRRLEVSIWINAEQLVDMRLYHNDQIWTAPEKLSRQDMQSDFFQTIARDVLHMQKISASLFDVKNRAESC